VQARSPGADAAARLPTFVIIGAPKAGTTALYWYLAEHPQVFMSRMKETNFFAFGLDDRNELVYGDPELHRFPVRSLAAYRDLFAGAGDAIAVGEASPIYLECPQAADRMRALVPDARIVCILREPVDRAWSDYLMYLRARDRRIDLSRDLTSSAPWAQPTSHWMRIGRYHEALSRYIRAFGRDRIDVFLFDDLREDPLRFVRRVYTAIGVDPDFEPDMHTPHNVGGMPSSRAIERLLTNKSLRRMVDPWVPRRAADLARRVRTRNLRKPPSLPPDLKRELGQHFREDIEATSRLIGRNLDHWLSTTQQVTR
jgi:Sulfotransferase family